MVAETAADARDVMVEGSSGILAISPLAERPLYEPSKRRLTWPNGAVATIFNATEPDQLRGPQFTTAWCDELAKWAYAQECWDQLQFGLRVGDKPRAIITTTPRPIKIIKELMTSPRCVVTRGRTDDNADNLAATFLATVTDRYGGTRLGRQELDAEILDDVPGALWTRAILDRAFIKAIPPGVDLRRVVVALDPAVTSGENSDEFGIIAAALGSDGHGYVLEDATGRYPVLDTPTDNGKSLPGWPKKAIELYRRYKADRIVAEVNNGGDMIEATLRMVDASVSYSAVHASRGKVVRAEPAAALYEKNLVHHVGSFAKLEDEMAAFTSDYDRSRDGSPNRVDALVWALTELKIDPSGATGMLDFYRQQAETDAANRGIPLALSAPVNSAPASPTGLPAAPAFVTLRCPIGSGVVCGLSRREYTPDSERFIHVLAEDAPPLLRAGFLAA